MHPSILSLVNPNRNTSGLGIVPTFSYPILFLSFLLALISHFSRDTGLYDKLGLHGNNGMSIVCF